MELLPQQAVAEIMKLSEEQSRLSEDYTALEVAKIEHFNNFRQDFNSDKAVEMAFARSSVGIEHMKMQMRLKILGKELSVLKTLMRHFENKGRNIY